MNRLSVLAFTAAAALAAPVAAEVPVPSGAYALDNTHASITWRVSHIGLSNYTARFTDFDIDLNLDVEDPTKSTVTATINPTSVETDYPGEKDFDGEIANNAKFLNAGEFPEITFTSTGIEMTGDNTAIITGDLTMLGQTVPVTLDTTLNGALERHPFMGKPAVGFSAVGTLDRTEYGFNHLVPTVGAEVSFHIEAEFVKAD